MTNGELRDYVEEQRSLNNIPYHVYSTLIDGIDTLEQEPTTKNDLGVDYISRKAALDITWHDPSYSDPLNVLTEVRDKVRELPSVTPQEPKTGHWIDSSNGWMCSECNKDNTFDTNYCPNCGARMIEPQESEEA